MQNWGFGGEKQTQKAVFLVLKTEFWWQEKLRFWHKIESRNGAKRSFGEKKGVKINSKK